MAGRRGRAVDLSAVRLGGDPMTVSGVLDVAGRWRSRATMPGDHAGRAPPNQGQLYPADRPSVEQIIAELRQTAADRHGARLRALIVVLGPAGLRVQEALALGERDLDPRRGSLLVRRDKGPSARDRPGPRGAGAAIAVAEGPGRAAGRAAVLHHRRPDAWPVVVERRGPSRVPPARRPGGRAASLRPAPTAPRPRPRARA